MVTDHSVPGQTIRFSNYSTREGNMEKQQSTQIVDKFRQAKIPLDFERNYSIVAKCQRRCLPSSNSRWVDMAKS